MKWITPPVRLHISQIYHKNLGIPQVKFMLNIVVIGLTLAQLPDLPPLALLTPENAAQIAQIARLGDGIAAMTAEDGQWRLEATTIGVRLTDLGAPDAPQRWLEGQNGAASVTFIPNQGYIASGGGRMGAWSFGIFSPASQFCAAKRIFTACRICWSARMGR